MTRRSRGRGTETVFQIFPQVQRSEEIARNRRDMWIQRKLMNSGFKSGALSPGGFRGDGGSPVSPTGVMHQHQAGGMHPGGSFVNPQPNLSGMADFGEGGGPGISGAGSYGGPYNPEGQHAARLPPHYETEEEIPSGGVGLPGGPPSSSEQPQFLQHFYPDAASSSHHPPNPQQPQQHPPFAQQFHTGTGPQHYDPNAGGPPQQPNNVPLAVSQRTRALAAPGSIAAPPPFSGGGGAPGGMMSAASGSAYAAGSSLHRQHVAAAEYVAAGYAAGSSLHRQHVAAAEYVGGTVGSSVQQPAGAQRGGVQYGVQYGGGGPGAGGAAPPLFYPSSEVVYSEQGVGEDGVLRSDTRLLGGDKDGGGDRNVAGRGGGHSAPGDGGLPGGRWSSFVAIRRIYDSPDQGLVPPAGGLVGLFHKQLWGAL